MKKTFKTMCAMLMACVMLFSGTLYAMAADASSNNDAVEAVSAKSYTCDYTSYARALDINSREWQLLAKSDSGFDCNVVINCRNTTFLSNGMLAKGLVRMLDKNNNVLWTSSVDYAVPGQGSYEYVCGSDVYKIEMKTQAGLGSAWITP